jgi:hypothetical protein
MQTFDSALLAELCARAAAAPRARAHHNIHAGNDDPVQRFLVAVQRSSYFRPHRHHTRSELAITLRGGFDVLSFDDSGTVTGRWSTRAGDGAFAYETPMGTWHTLLAREDASVFLEVKQGPYDPATAVDFAPWAPPEGDPAVAQYQQWLRAAGIGDRY